MLSRMETTKVIPAFEPGRFRKGNCRFRFVYPLVTLSNMKDAGLRIRVQRELRDKFVEACRAQDKPAAQVLREFMRDYIGRDEKHEVEGKKKEHAHRRHP